MNAKQYIKMAFQNLILPILYRLGCRQGVDPKLIVFADAHHGSRPENMELLYRALTDAGEESGCGRGGAWQVEELYLDYQKNPPLKVLRGMAAFMRLYARAGCVVICDNFLPAAGCQKRPGTKVVQLWHASGSLKKFGYDTTDDIPAGYRGNVFANTDLVTVSAPWCEAPFASAMRLPQTRVKALGISRTDRYFDAAWRARAAQRVNEAYPEAAGRRIAVWAPTFRGSPGAPQSIPFDRDALQRTLGEAWYVIVSTHPHMRDGRVMLTTEELFVCADCLIADYSSLIYEYLLVTQIMEEVSRETNGWEGKGRLEAGIDDAMQAPQVGMDDVIGASQGVQAGADDAMQAPREMQAGADDAMQAPRGVQVGAGGRGLVLYIPDYQDYADRRGFYMPYEEIPGTRAYAFDDLADAVKGETQAARADMQHRRMQRQRFLQTYMSACDGRSTQRIAGWIMENAGKEGTYS